MNQDLDQLVDTCLSEIQTGQLTIEACQEQHPEHAADLAALLRLAVQSHTVMAPTSPTVAYVEATRARIMNQLKSQSRPPKKKTIQTSGRGWFNLRPAYVVVAVVLMIALFGSSFGVLRASADSLPGDRLYRVKLAGEQIQLMMSFSVERDEKLLFGFAEERLEETDSLLDQERYEDLDLAMQGLDDAIEALALLPGSQDHEDPGTFTHIEQEIIKHVEVLQRVLDRVPESARSAIERAIGHSNHSQELIKNVKAGDHPGNSNPGQLKKDGQSVDGDGELPGPGNGRDKEKPLKPVKTEKP